jgi:thiamine biosynthesis protein ThiS
LRLRISLPGLKLKLEARKLEPETNVMRLTINGEEHEIAAPLTLSSLIEQLGMKGDRVAVELNRDIIRREQWPETALKDGDRLEIVHFVGGGRETGLY